MAKDKGQEIFTSGLDLGNLEMELIQCLNIIRSKELLEPMQAAKHMYKQWQVLRQKEAPVCETLRKLIKRAQRAPNSQAGCERSNSKYARYKTKYSNRMGIEIIRARARAGENGPPILRFPAQKARQYWQDNNHRLALKVKDTKSLVLARMRKEASNYTSRIFIDL